MTSSARGRTIAAVLVGSATLLLLLTPSALIVAIIALGALGEADYARLGVPSIVMFVAMGSGSGYLVRRWLDQAWSEPGRRPADVWIAYLVAVTILFVGVILVPLLVVLLNVDSDHSLSDRALLVEIMWFIGHIGLTVLAYLAARALFNIKRPETTHIDAAWP